MTQFPPRVALQLKPQHADYVAIRRTVREAEDLGVDIIFNWDHFYPLYGDPDGKHYECWTMLGAWAEQTRRVQLGALVTCNSYRNPALLADMARTVDNISDGRLILGIGAGWFQKDYDQYGYEFLTPSKRLDDLAAALPRIESRLALLNPPPVRRIPVLIGGGGERKTLRLVARHAQIWHCWGSPEVLARKSAVLAAHCAEIGRDPAEIEHSCDVAKPVDGGGPGTPDGPAADVGPELLELGVSTFVVGVGGPDLDLKPLRQWLAWRDSLAR
jgi:probable F420-dependent oxidoreductase